MPAERLARAAVGLLARGALLFGGAALAVRLGIRAQGGGADQLRPQEDSGDLGRGRPSVAPSARALRAGHETADMDAALMARLVLALGGGVTAMVFGMVGFRTLVGGLHERAQPPLTAEQVAPITPPGPHLQADPLGDIAAFRQREERLLNDYAWIDPGRTRARIPIERAMALVVGRTLDGGAP